MKHCKKYGLIANGGPKSRFMAGKENELPNGIKEINKNVKLIEDAIKCLNNGKMLDKNGLFVDNKTVLKVKGIGPARAISFPSLCCFTGFGTSEYAIQTAKQAILNSETANGYAGDNEDQLSKLGKILRVDGDSPPYKDEYYCSILEAAGKSVGDVQSTMENAVCAMTRTIKKRTCSLRVRRCAICFLNQNIGRLQWRCE